MNIYSHALTLERRWADAELSGTASNPSGVFHSIMAYVELMVKEGWLSGDIMSDPALRLMAYHAHCLYNSDPGKNPMPWLVDGFLSAHDLLEFWRKLDNLFIPIAMAAIAWFFRAWELHLDLSNDSGRPTYSDLRYRVLGELARQRNE